MDTAPKPAPRIKQITNDSPKNVVNSVKLKAELAFQEAGILDQQGRLTQEVIDVAKDSKALLDGAKLKNPHVIKILTKDGSLIKDWQKLSTRSIAMPNGEKRRIHFYMNKKTGRVNYETMDYKVKDLVSGMPKHQKAIRDSEIIKNLLRDHKKS